MVLQQLRPKQARFLLARERKNKNKNSPKLIIIEW